MKNEEKEEKWAEFSVESEKEPSVNAVKVPDSRANRNLGSTKLCFPVRNRWSYGLKVMLRNACKRLPEYHVKISPCSEGMDDSGNVISVNTLGRWAFGVPGYMGHLMFEGGVDDEIVVWIPDGSPSELIDMLKKAVDMIGR